jgi:hypothetical protein
MDRQIKAEFNRELLSCVAGAWLEAFETLRGRCAEVHPRPCPALYDLIPPAARLAAHPNSDAFALAQQVTGIAVIATAPAFQGPAFDSQVLASAAGSPSAPLSEARPSVCCRGAGLWLRRCAARRRGGRCGSCAADALCPWRTAASCRRWPLAG